MTAVLLVSMAPASSASTITFTTGPQSVGGLSENATATFVTNNAAHTITITLLNEAVNPTSTNQTIGSLRFTLNSIMTPTMGAVSDTKFDVKQNDGSPRFINEVTTSPWTVGVVSQTANSEQIGLCTVCVNPNGSADGLVIGGPNAANNRYNTALSSNGNGDRYIIGSGAAYSSGQPFFGLNTLPSWTISVGNVDISNLKISNVIFGFGESSTTDYGWNSITVPADTPEPGSVILFTTGLGLMALGARKRLLRRS